MEHENIAPHHEVIRDPRDSLRLGRIPVGETLVSPEGRVSAGFETAFDLAIAGIPDDRTAEFSALVKQANQGNEAPEATTKVSRIWVDQAISALARHAGTIENQAHWADVLLTTVAGGRDEEHVTNILNFAAYTWERRDPNHDKSVHTAGEALRNRLAETFSPVVYRSGTDGSGISSAMQGDVVCGVCSGKFQGRLEQFAQTL